jgi:hypothetical protein
LNHERRGIFPAPIFILNGLGFFAIVNWILGLRAGLGFFSGTTGSVTTVGSGRLRPYVPFSKTGAELIFDVVNRAHERTSLIATPRLPFEQWTEEMGSEQLTSALLDRLSHRVYRLEANGERYRRADAKRRLKRK